MKSHDEKMQLDDDSLSLCVMNSTGYCAEYLLLGPGSLGNCTSNIMSVSVQTCHC